jgi:16S rRNA (guanine966-N2)-methyltransferase
VWLAWGRLAAGIRVPKPPAKPRSSTARPERELRIIAGQWRGRRWRFPEGEIRPTGDRVRETLFNWLQARIVGRRCLDLYAGSGALGLEALSRGAAQCVFVDREPRVLKGIAACLEAWQAPPGAAQLLETPAQRYLARAPEGAGAPFDIVFLDPPFAGDGLAAAIARLAQPGWLAPRALVYIEQPRELSLPALPQGWQMLRSGTAGAVGYHLAELSAREGQPP